MHTLMSPKQKQAMKKLLSVLTSLGFLNFIGTVVTKFKCLEPLLEPWSQKGQSNKLHDD